MGRMPRAILRTRTFRGVVAHEKSASRSYLRRATRYMRVGSHVAVLRLFPRMRHTDEGALRVGLFDARGVRKGCGGHVEVRTKSWARVVTLRGARTFTYQRFWGSLPNV